MIPEKQLKKFKEIYKKCFGKDLSDDDALEKATKLLRTVEITYKPMTVEQYKALQKRRKEIGKRKNCGGTD